LIIPVNSFVRISSVLSRDSEGGKRGFPTGNNEESFLVHWSNELSNPVLVKAFLKTADFTKEMDV